MAAARRTLLHGHSLKDRKDEAALMWAAWMSHSALEEQLTHLAPYLQAILDEEREVNGVEKRMSASRMRKTVSQVRSPQRAHDTRSRRVYSVRNRLIGR